MYPELERAAKYFIGGVIALLVMLMLVSWAAAQGKPEGTWWDHPRVRACCSVADAVYADRWEVQPDGSVLATVTDGTQQTSHWADQVIGKTYHVPADKVLDIPGNPTGRALLFVHPTTHSLYCFAYGPLI
jgi:hypothetical protein